MKPKGFLRRFFCGDLWWDGLCALTERTGAAFRQLFRLPPKQPKHAPPPRKRSYWPTAETLETRFMMSAVAFSASSFSAGEGDGTKVITVELDSVAANTITVNYNPAGGTAGFFDYGGGSGTLTFVPGDTNESFTVFITGDSLDENDETVLFALSNAIEQGVGSISINGTNPVTLTITDDDPLPSVSFASTSSTYGENGYLIFLTVNLSTASGRDVSVPYSFSGTAVNGTDYVPQFSSPLTISAGQTSGSVQIILTNDTLDEDSETAVVTLGSPTNASLGANTTHTVTITDDDSPPTVAFTVSSSTANEAAGSKLISVSLSQASGKTITVDYATSSGTATSGSDFTAVSSGQVTFAPGETTKTASASITNDTTPEASEDFTVTLSNPSNATLGMTTTHTVTITDTETTGISEFPFSTANAGPWGVVTGPDGNLWVTLANAGKVAQVTTTGTVTEYSLGASSQPRGIAVVQTATSGWLSTGPTRSPR